jgi:hypothetical protein
VITYQGDAGDDGIAMSRTADISADEALQRLISGNERFLKGKARARKEIENG